jgi:hypothetical protein
MIRLKVQDIIIDNRSHTTFGFLGRQAGKKAGRQAGRQAPGMQAGRQTWQRHVIVTVSVAVEQPSATVSFMR